ncbi:hypothetical protein ACXEO8_15000 [Cytobacillus firmus]|uniref:hypothetical protein n=1 Tax=Cytobacillus firmus TaxID=1399 RepID=UPI001C9512BD|nr:hypothetical protein [Cytobacillus firmus]MBY6053809.1 hypothetical protein [Cytobacillus firmus]URT68947.1 hypothetical protein NAF01_14115 [Cytobacillus firmus]
MYSVLTYFVSLVVIVISVFTTLFIKNELERMFREKNKMIPFHISNVLLTLMVSFAAHAVFTIYIIGDEFNWLLQLAILIFMILPIYIFGHLAFEKYKSVYKKYIPAESGKILVLNEKYLKKKKWPSKFKNYNDFSKEK